MIGFTEGGGRRIDVVPPSVTLTDQAFTPSGWLQAALNLEHRPQQEAMAQAVARAMADDLPLVFEAG
ncbi:MAG: hypothetical protein AAGF10_00005, partial [Verrucomicrobiota bacterium]